MRKLALGVAAAALSGAASAGGASASACNDPSYETIRFAPGAVCWNYRGRATHFVGQFAAGQAIQAQAAGQASYASESGRVQTRWEPRQINIEGPGGFSAFGDGTLRATLRGSGRYTFSIGPCAVWHAPGTIRICTR